MYPLGIALFLKGSLPNTKAVDLGCETDDVFLV